MKPQDIIFICSVVVLLFVHKPKYTVYAGIVSCIIAIPLFYFWIFFTAGRLTWYAAAYFLIAMALYTFERRNI